VNTTVTGSTRLETTPVAYPNGGRETQETRRVGACRAREALLEVLIHDRVTSLRQNAERLGNSDTPREALIEWLQEFGRCATAYRGLAESILATAALKDSDLNTDVEHMRAAAALLLTKAQKAGAIRPDVTPAEVFTLACGAGTASPYTTADPDRLLRLLVEGLMPR
jgi:hypothetical protein